MNEVAAFEFGAWWGTFVHHAMYVGGGLVLTIGAMWVLRNFKPVQEMVLPLLDNLRAAIIKALDTYCSKADISDREAQLAGQAMIAAAIICAITLYAIATLLAHVSTPVG